VASKSINETLVADITQRLEENKPVRRTLPDGGRIHIDRQLPFLVVYRPPASGEDAGTELLVKGEASYLIAPRDPRHRRSVARLASEVASTMIEVFGKFLVIEVWSGSDQSAALFESGASPPPGFRVVVPRSDADSPSVARLVEALRRVQVLGRNAEVELVPGGRLSPPETPRLARQFGTAESDVRLIGIEVRPVYRDVSSGDEYPGVRRSLHRQLSGALQQSAYEFAVHQTTHRPRHYQALGRRAFVKAVADVDHRLSAVASAFDLLLLISPVNTDQAYRSFRRRKATKPPVLRYRALDVDPARLKRKLYGIQVDRVEDPTLAAIFTEKQRELSLKLDLLSDRDTPRFLHTGVALYGDVDAPTVETARHVFAALPEERQNGGRSIDSTAFAIAAQQEIDRYRAVYPSLGAEVRLRSDLATLMVSSGHLLVGTNMRFPLRRVDALLQHEVGTHVVTFWNGSAQRLRLLATGLAGHDELQEGLAVLAEYLVDGLTAGRLRTLAGRVLAARSVLDGAEFLDTYRMLTVERGMSERGGFHIATRVHRGGGFVKDAVYLRGLQKVADFLAEGGRLDTLLTGKIAVEHVAVIEELQRRGVLLAPPLRPAYLDEPDTHYQLEKLRTGVDLVSLVEGT
jgi:uncharacterized protein (TIGR02421 family)